jgi:arabinose-5-phosphate isomerase
MMMALGDALAVALLERMGLTKEQYKVFHPGGKLGQRLRTVGEMMHGGENLPLIRDDAKMDEALLVLTGKNLGCALVVDKAGKLKGIITDGDLKRHMGPDLLQKPVTAVMTASPRSIEADALAVEAVNLMTRTKGRYVTSLVVNGPDGKLEGLIRLQDCLQAGIV